MAVLLPGATYRVFARRLRAQPTPPPFEEALFITLAGLVVAALSLVVIGGLRALTPSWYPDPSALIDGPGSYTADHYRLVFRTAILYGLISNAIAAALGLSSQGVSRRVLSRLGVPERATQHDVWSTYVVDRCPLGAQVKAAVEVESGVVISGTVGALEVVESQPSVVLEQPMFVQRATALKSEPVDPRWHAILIAGSRVRSVSLTYVSAVPGDESAKP